MILLLDTSTPVCKMSLVDDTFRYDNEWKADRELAHGLLKYLRDQLEKNGKTWTNISAIGVFKGPGSFTGLRIGLTVLNTMAESLNIPIVSAGSESWQEEAIEKIKAGQNERIILPLYGSAPNITKPRK